MCSVCNDPRTKAGDHEILPTGDHTFGPVWYRYFAGLPDKINAGTSLTIGVVEDDSCTELGPRPPTGGSPPSPTPPVRPQPSATTATDSALSW
jgi:hypothetical protein